jgi:hypothetical protein
MFMVVRYNGGAEIPCCGIYPSQCGNLRPSFAHGSPPQHQTSHLPNHPSENTRPPSQAKWTCIDYLRYDIVQRFNLSLKKVTMELKFFAVESVPYRVNTSPPNRILETSSAPNVGRSKPPGLSFQEWTTFLRACQDPIYFLYSYHRIPNTAAVPA